MLNLANHHIAFPRGSDLTMEFDKVINWYSTHVAYRCYMLKIHRDVIASVKVCIGFLHIKNEASNISVHFTG